MTIINFNFHEIYQNLNETIIWCTKKIDISNPKNSLRNLSDDNLNSIIHMSYYRCNEIVKKIINKRSLELKNFNLIFLEKTIVDNPGKLFLFYPDWSLSDGAAEPASKGFIDSYNVPPSDTWVFYGSDNTISDKEANNFLLCWSPDEFIDLVQGAIYANPEECIKWALDVDRNFTQFLKENDLMW